MAIQYIDQGNTHGYQVRCGPRGAVRTKFFANKKHGGAAKARALAEAAEAALLREVGDCGPPRHHLGGRNRSGVVGMSLHYAPARDGGAPHLHIRGTWRVNGKTKGTGMSAQKHGILEAVRMVRERREAATGESLGLTPRAVWNLLQTNSGYGERT